MKHPVKFFQILLSSFRDVLFLKLNRKSAIVLTNSDLVFM